MSLKIKIFQSTVSVAILFLISMVFMSCAGIQGIFPNMTGKKSYPRPVVKPVIETKNEISEIQVIEKIPAREPSKWAQCLTDGEPSADCIQKTQEFLFELTYHPGPRDGILGERTRQAITKFQKDMGMETDGLISESLLSLLENMAPLSLMQNEPGQGLPDITDGIRRTQALLSKLGYHPGPIDGILGRRSREAIQNFQKDTNLIVNGRPSQYLLGKLKDRVDSLYPPAETITVAKEASRRTRTPPASLKPKLYLLAVGASKYRNTELALAYPSKDARDFAAIMASQEDMLYRNVEVKLLTDPGRDTILAGLEWLERETTSHDVAMVFLAGHGVADRNNNYYFLPVEGDPDRLKRTAISFSEIESTLIGLPGKIVAFVDTCHAGGMMGKRLRGASMNINSIARDLSDAENGVVVFASATGRQNALEDDRWQNGAFTKALVEGISGKADINADQAISITELDYYLSERVKALTGGRQTPATAKPATVQDFPVAIKNGF